MSFHNCRFCFVGALAAFGINTFFLKIRKKISSTQKVRTILLKRYSFNALKMCLLSIRQNKNLFFYRTYWTKCAWIYVIFLVYGWTPVFLLFHTFSVIILCIIMKVPSLDGRLFRISDGPPFFAHRRKRSPKANGGFFWWNNG